MKVLLLNDSDNQGGAARGAHRLYQGLQQVGVHTNMLVRYQCTDDPGVLSHRTLLTKISRRMDNLPLLRYPDRQVGLFSSQWFPNRTVKQIRRLQPDILHLNWICSGYLTVEAIGQLRQPIVWTLRDMWAFTGGCHYSQSCDRYQQTCGRCPHLGSSVDQDLSRWIWYRKRTAWRDLNLTLVAPSQWMADCARKSALFQHHRIEVIHHGLNLQTFHPTPTRIARASLQLPQDKQIIVFGAPNALEDPRKGFQYLLPALQQLIANDWGQRIHLVIFGADNPEMSIQLNCPVTSLGHIDSDQTLALLYAAADVMIVPSLHEAFGHTACEAIASGTPVVGFNATGIKDIVTHQQSGYLARPYQIDDLARGIAWVLQDPQRHTQLRQAARSQAVANFDYVKQAAYYAQLFQDLLEQEPVHAQPRVPLSRKMSDLLPSASRWKG